MFDKAIEACDYATVADDEFADAYLMKGHSFFQLGNEESAMENYLQAEKFHLVSHGFINTSIGLNKTSKGEWKEGYDYLEKAITAEDSHDFALHFSLCQCSPMPAQDGKETQSTPVL